MTNAQTIAREFAAVNAAFSEDQAARGVKALARAIGGYSPIGQTYHDVGVSITGNGVGKKAAIESAKVGHKFVIDYSAFDGVSKVSHKGGFSIKSGYVKLNLAGHFVSGKDSRIAAIVEDVKPSGHGLRAEAFSDYNADGYNDEGQSIYNVGHHTADQVADITIKGVNAAQRNAYRVNGTIKAAADIFALLGKESGSVVKAAKHAATKRANDLADSGKIERGSHIIDVELGDSFVRRYAEGTQFIVDNGQGFFRIHIDARGRQYAVGSFNHFDTAVLHLVAPSDHLAGKHLDDVGIKRDKAVASIEAFVTGKASALNVFFQREEAKTRSGKYFIKYRFDFAAFTAAIHFYAKR